jgi:CubicO group peptidase (beta-lactamase class C family)
MFHTLLLASILPLLCQVDAACFDPSPAFPPPKFDAEDPILSAAFASLEGTIGTFAKGDAFNTTSFSVQVTSSQSTLWSYHHTARELNSSRVGANPVDGDSFYRIASITKTFTTLALLQQAAAGNLSLDDPVNKYLPDLKGPIPWKDMTLRTIASQLSGLPRDCTSPFSFTACFPIH